MPTEHRRTDRASKLVNVPPSEIFAALTDQGAVASWLPPKGTTGEIQEFEARVGGQLRMTLRFSGEAAGKGKSTRDSDQIDARFTALEPGRLVRWDVEFESDDPRFAGTMTMGWSLSNRNGATEVEIVAENVPPGIDPEDHQKGLKSSLEQLAACVERR